MICILRQYLSTPVLSLSTGFLSFKTNRDKFGSTNLSYNKARWEFVLAFKNIKLYKENFKLDASLNSNLISNSTFDLENLSVILYQTLPKIKIIDISFLQISSKELNLMFKLLEKTENDNVFICTNKLKL